MPKVLPRISSESQQNLQHTASKKFSLLHLTPQKYLIFDCCFSFISFSLNSKQSDLSMENQIEIYQSDDGESHIEVKFEQNNLAYAEDDG
jgi:hypothetical protein